AIVAILVVAVIGLALYATTLPAGYAVERSVVIAADPALVREYAADLARWDDWTPWKEIDPTIEVTLGERTRGVGAHQSWTGKSGTGELTITADDPDHGIEYDMAFDEGAFVSKGALEWEPVDGGTRVTWRMWGDAPGLVARLFFHFFSMEDRIGQDFDRGLAKLKQVVEQAAAEAASAEAPAEPESATAAE
ncbi:MAG: hypothetical protein D6738_14935, partial [Acidobacteria bacterium]